jgi:pimeloyl-ACP methyl ester carboxylesterase
MEVGWEEPRYAAFLRRLARGRRLILFDRRGMGMSDPAPPTVTLAERTGDIRAVMDAAGSNRAVNERPVRAHRRARRDDRRCPG